ncbi:MAG TPA: ABC transporter permease [Bryobacteraceae bacterium]|nr:ABC transporter permease [Bryobacteraceae bacterium]
MQTLLQDLHFGWRVLRKSPALTALVAATLALGIGANAWIFSIVNGFLLRPLPVPHAEQIAVLASSQPGSSPFVVQFSYPDFADFRKQAEPFADLYAYRLATAGISTDNRADQTLVAFVSGNYFPVLGVKPLAGHLISGNEEDQPGTQPLMVLGYSFWMKRFAGDPGVIGKQVRVNGQAVTIAGVVPREFTGTYSVLEMDGYLPLRAGAAIQQVSTSVFDDRSARSLLVQGRLRTGVSFSQAQASINVIAARLAKQYPSTDGNVTVTVYREQMARPVPLGSNIVPVAAACLLALAGVLLLLACMNVANVLLARATVRQREMGLRAALGAARSRLMRQVLTETVLLGFLGGALGVIIGLWADPGDVSKYATRTTLPLHLDFGFDWRVYAYSFAAALFTGIFVGLWPALRASRADLNTVLQEGGRSDTAGAQRQRLRGALVVAQMAASMTLLVIAGLFIRSLQHAETMYLGFDPDHLVNLSVDPHQIGYDDARTNEFYRRLEAAARALPGVQSVSMSFGVPMGTTNIVNGGTVAVEGETLRPGQPPPSVFFNNISPNYFATMRVPLLRGRAFGDSDNETAPAVAIVNQTMAERFWPGQNPVGKRFILKTAIAPAKTLQIVGLAGNGKYAFIAEEPRPFFYVPLAQNFLSTRALQVRSSVAPETLIEPLRAKLHELAPDLPVMQLETMRQTLSGSNGLQVFRFGAQIATTVGVIGLILAIVGIYGVVSFTAAQRTREIGIRMALGGSAREVLGLILGQGIRLVAIGLALGVVATLGLTRVMARLLIGVSPSDPLTYASIGLLLAAVALAACWIPARRATRVDPGVALRYE